MPFLGPIKLECWRRIIKNIDDMIWFVVGKALGEKHFDYNYTWCSNTEVIRCFISFLIRAEMNLWDVF